MVWGTLLAVSLGHQSVFLRVKAPPDTKVEYRTTLNMDAGSSGSLEAFIFSGCRILSNVRTQYRCRMFVADAKVAGSGMFRGQSQTYRQMKGMTADYNRTATNATISAWNDGRKIQAGHLEGFTDLILPQAPVTVGSKWQQDQSIGGSFVRVNYELVGFGTEKYNRTALIQGMIDIGQDIQTMEPNQYVVDLDTGLVRRAAGKFVLSVNDLNIVTSFKVTRASLIVPPPKILNKQPAKKAPAKPKPKLNPKKKP